MYSTTRLLELSSCSVVLPYGFPQGDIVLIHTIAGAIDSDEVHVVKYKYSARK